MDKLPQFCTASHLSKYLHFYTFQNQFFVNNRTYHDSLYQLHPISLDNTT